MGTIFNGQTIGEYDSSPMIGLTRVSTVDSAGNAPALIGCPVMYNYNGVAFPTRISICPLTTPVWFVNRIDATQPTDFIEGLDVLTAVRL